MSSDEQDRPRKTLTIKKTARDAHAEEAPKRVRTGARARLVAQISRTKDSVERQKDPEGYQRRQEEEARRRPGAGARGQAPREGQYDRGSSERRSSERGQYDRDPSDRRSSERGQYDRGPSERRPSEPGRYDRGQPNRDGSRNAAARGSADRSSSDRRPSEPGRYDRGQPSRDDGRNAATRGSADLSSYDRRPSEPGRYDRGQPSRDDGRNAAARGSADRTSSDRRPPSRNRADDSSRDSAPSMSARSGRAPQRAPRLRDDQYIAPATPDGRFYDPFEDDGPAPEFMSELEQHEQTAAPDLSDERDTSVGRDAADEYDVSDDRDSSDEYDASDDRDASDEYDASDSADERDSSYERAPRVETRSRRPREARQAEVFTVFAPCPQGLEEALTAEMQALGYDDAKAGRAGCSFSADWAGVQRANLYSRLATRILVQVAHAEISHEDDILDLARDTPWERWFGAEQTLRVDTSAIKSPVQSLQYCNLRAKDGICDRLRELEGERPSIDTVRPDARVHLFLTGHTATLYLDTSGESLFKRGWRLDKGEAPLRENLAAGMLALAGWDPAAPLLDPFCGSGTILIEAAWIALGVPPGISRPFGFERLRDHDAYRWRDLKDDARSRILPQLEAPLVGYDLDPQAIEFARNNAERAWLTEESIRFEVGDARQVTAPADHGWIVTNPPYGERMLTEQDADLWRDWATCLKHNFAGWQLHVITSDLTLPNQMRLKPKRRVPLYNGALDCRLFGFELVAAGYRDA